MPAIFELLRDAGQLPERDMLRTFNCGLGMVLVVPSDRVDAVVEASGGTVVGELVGGEDVELVG